MSDGLVQTWSISAHGDQLEFHRTQEKKPYFSIRASNHALQIESSFEPEQVSFWKSGKTPSFVSNYGTDEYGAWFEFEVPKLKQRRSSNATDAVDSAWNFLDGFAG